MYEDILTQWDIDYENQDSDHDRLYEEDDET